jgi:hypothetical protein
LDLPGYGAVLAKYVLPSLIVAIQSSDQQEREAAVMALLWIGTEEAMRAIGSSPHRADLPPLLTSSPEHAQFTAYYPHMTNPEKDNTLFVYAYVQRSLAQVHQDVMETRVAFEGSAPASGTAEQRLGLLKGTPITITPESEQVAFEPTSITQKWNGEWMQFRFAYKITAPISTDGLLIRVSIRIRAIEIAHIDCSTNVMRREASDGVEMQRVSRFSSQSAVPYQSIFVSYSRKDWRVVRMYRRVQDAVGNDVFVDTYSIRAGTDWRNALETAIDAADIFQLFWSANSAKSCSVRDEWTYALSTRHTETRCAGFIRPFYWTLPIPAKPPEELKHLNFRYVPLRRPTSRTR